MCLTDTPEPNKKCHIGAAVYLKQSLSKREENRMPGVFQEKYTGQRMNGS